MEIIDGHSHFGTDAFWKNPGLIDEYKRKVIKNNIKEVLAMSVPCPIIEKEKCKTVLLLNDYSNSRVKHFKRTIYLDKTTDENIVYGINPYSLANDMIYEQTRVNKDVIFHYVPLIHPLYYSIEDMLKNIKKGAVAFKIHPIACGITPEDVSIEFLKILEILQVPVILHTDYSIDDNILSRNAAMRWINILENYNIKVFFPHGVNLNRDAINIVNNDIRYWVGFAPDLLINSLKNRLEQDTKDYLKLCFDSFKSDKIVFDIDYPWNIISADNNELDWDFIERIKFNIPNSSEKKYYCDNIKKFMKRKY